MKITVEVPQKQAFKKGLAVWGALPVDDFEGVLGALNEKEREIIQVDSDGEIHLSGSTRRIVADSPAVEDVIAAIRSRIKERDEEVEAARKKAQKKLDEISEFPFRAFNPDLSRAYSFGEEKVKTLAKEARVSPRKYEKIIEKDYEELKEIWETRVLEALKNDTKIVFEGAEISLSNVAYIAERHNIKGVLAILEKVKEAKKKQQEEKEKKREVSKEIWKQWAAEHGSEDLKLAIKDDYPLGGSVEKEVAAYLLPAETNWLKLIDFVKTSEERRVPNARARKAKQYLEEQIKEKQGIEGTKVSVGRIHSVEIYVAHNCDDPYCEECDSDGEILKKQTAVPVEIKSTHHVEEFWYVIVE